MRSMASSRMLGRVLIAAVLATLATTSIRAAADEHGPSLGESLSGLAKGEYAAGRALFDDGDFANARVKFQSALDLSNDPRLLWNIGACERGLHHYAQ